MENLNIEPIERFKITIEDLHTKNTVTTTVNGYTEDTDSLNYAVNTAFEKAYQTIMGADMSDPKTKEQEQDLNWQKPEESDNLQKSQSPDAEYMKDRGLNRETHGKDQ